MATKNTKALFLGENVVVWTLNLLLLYTVKYRNQQLVISEFHLTIGNILNLFTVVAQILLLVVLLYVMKHPDFSKLNQLLFMSFLVFLSLFSVFVITEFNIKFPKYYIGYYSMKKVVIIALYILVQFLHYISIAIIINSLAKKRKKFYLRSLLNAIIMLVVMCVISFFYLQSDLEINKHEKHDLCVVLGAAVWSNNKPSPALRERVDKAVELYYAGKIKTIQLTGGNAPGELSEADVAFNYIKEKYKDIKLENDVQLEKQTTSTVEQVGFIKALKESGQAGSVVIVSDKYHLRRTLNMCDFFNVDADAAPTDNNFSFLTKFQKGFRETFALIIFWLFAY